MNESYKYYTLYSVDSNKVLDVNEGSWDNCASIIQYEFNGGQS